MSSTSLTTADRPPEDPALVSGFYAGLLEILNDDGRDRHGWVGSTIADYGKSNGIVFLQIVPGEGGFATLDDLRTFREEQRKAREDHTPPQQGSLL